MFAAVVTTVLLAGCGGLQPPIGVLGGTSQSPATAAHANRGGSWMLPEAKTEDLIYLSGYVRADTIYVYSYHQGKLVGMLTGFNDAHGLCVDRGGDVFVTDLYGQDVVEYAHGDTMPKAQLSDTGYAPNGCDVDPRTGDLAVANYCGKSVSDCIGSNAGNVVIYKKAQGKPTPYHSAALAQYFFCGYDNSGNLYVDGLGPPSDTGFHFVTIRDGSTNFRTIVLNETIHGMASVQWDGSHIVVGDASYRVLYQFTIEGNKGTEVGSTPLRNSLFAQFWIDGNKVLATTTRYGYKQWVKLYDYPSGHFARGFHGNRAYGITVSRVRR